MTPPGRSRGRSPGPGRPPSVAVLLGGPSAEHDVSIVSGTAVAEALGAAGFPVQAILVDLDGNWWWLPPDHRREARPPAVYDDPAGLGALGPFRTGAALDRLALGEPRPVVFVALHGPFGEDGTIQALLEAAGLAYTGSGVTASALGMDKVLFKRLVRGLGLPVVEWREVRAERWAADPAAVLAELEAFATATGDERLMVKPARLGSSVGMTLAHDRSERAGALDEAFRFDTLALVERYLAGARDLEVAVIGNEPEGLEVCGPGEVIPGREFYDYRDKYLDGRARILARAELAPELEVSIRRLAREAYLAIGAEGFARVDFLLAGGAIYLNEINTIPGFTPISLFPAMAAAAGHDFAALVGRIVVLALEREARRARPRLRPADLPR